MKLEIYQTNSKKPAWSWRIKARNGRIVATPGEDFVSRGNARRSLYAFLDGVKKEELWDNDAADV